jgi:hypothetical protein
MPDVSLIGGGGEDECSPLTGDFSGEAISSLLAKVCSGTGAVMSVAMIDVQLRELEVD